MDELVAWLRAQFDEDELVAREVPPRFQLFDGTGIVVMHVFGGGTRSVTLPSSVARFAVCQDPARVLREVESKRAIVHWCAEVIGDRDLSQYGDFGALKDDPQALAVTLAVETLRNLALPYADRPGYREEWRPPEAEQHGR